MKTSKETIGVILLIIGFILFTSGVYHLGYHKGLEFLRKSDSGLGGLVELLTAWIQIAGGLITLIIGLLLKITAHNNGEHT